MKKSQLKKTLMSCSEVVLCSNCRETFDRNKEAEHRASISHQLSLKHAEDGIRRNPGFLLNESNLGFQMMKKSNECPPACLPSTAPGRPGSPSTSHTYHTSGRGWCTRLLGTSSSVLLGCRGAKSCQLVRINL